MKLNKNQLKFFIAAINHYGAESGDVRLKDITAFAQENDLIVPTSALKKGCQQEGLQRGHYNLLLTGITPPEKESPAPAVDPPPVMPEPEEEVSSPAEESFNDDPIIMNTPVYADLPTKRIGKTPHYEPEPGQKEKEWIRPLYIVVDGQGNVRGVHETPRGAFERRIQVFHDNGLMSYDDFLTRMKYVGAALIKSATTTSLECLIEIREIEA